MTGKGNWGHKSYGYHPQHRRVFPALEATPDITRGEQRLAAEVALAQQLGLEVPNRVFNRARLILEVLAAG